METETTTATPPTALDREKTAPFLIRAFVQTGSFHRLTIFDDNKLPIADEHQIFAWKDATLRELLTTLRITALSPELRHPLARFSFRAVFADPANRGRFNQKELGMVYSRDILGEPGTLTEPAARLLVDTEPARGEGVVAEGREERTLDDLRFHPGDYLCIAVFLPKNVVVGPEASPSINIKGSAAAAANGWKNDRDIGRGERAVRGGDGGWGGSVAPDAASGRGGGHWRGASNAEDVDAEETLQEGIGT
ncbi:hypothetical protein HWV62_25530 [Athelia sp. TMB]|nr:hypothetical protein HWV62_25530 [Athelia sp. TMB]